MAGRPPDESVVGWSEIIVDWRSGTLPRGGMRHPGIRIKEPLTGQCDPVLLEVHLQGSRGRLGTADVKMEGLTTHGGGRPQSA